MESKFFPFSPSAGHTKRVFSDEIQDSPTAKRAKRAKNHKKRRSKGEKGEKDSDGYVEQQDWISSADTSMPTRSPNIKQETPIKPPTPFPLKEIHKARVLKPAEKAAKEQLESATRKDEPNEKADTKNGAKHPAALESPKTEANTRKTRGGADLKGEVKKPIHNGNKIPAVAGPSKPRSVNRTVASEPRELTDLSDLTPRVDYTFKSFPNPTLIPFPPLRKTKELTEPDNEEKPNGATKSKETKNTESFKTKSTNGITNEAGTPMELDTSPIPDALQTVPAGTKTLKAINKHLKAISATLAVSHPDQITADLQSLRTDIAQLHARLDCDAVRAAVRHEILFNALIKVSGDICALNGLAQGEDGQGPCDVTDGETTTTTSTNTIAATNGTTPAAGTPRKGNTGGGKSKLREIRKDRKEKRGKSMLQARKTLEQCLRIYSEDMERAGSREEVSRYGELMVQYAGDLFKTLG